MTAAPQVKPAPKTTNKIRSPRWICPDRRLVERNGDGSRGSVAILVNIDKELLGPGAQALAHRLDNAKVGLVRIMHLMREISISQRRKASSAAVCMAWTALLNVSLPSIRT